MEITVEISKIKKLTQRDLYFIKYINYVNFINLLNVIKKYVKQFDISTLRRKSGSRKRYEMLLFTNNKLSILGFKKAIMVITWYSGITWKIH